MQRDDDEDAAWRAIVDNYGKRPDLGPEVGPDTFPDPARDLADLADLADPAVDDDWGDEPAFPDDDRFVPPPPPPLPRPSRDRLIAWLGVFGSPAVLLICLIAGIGLPRLLAYGLVAAFVGGFVYLVWRMPRGPRDPWDDGAKV